MTEVTETRWVNQYTYDPKNLLIAYGYVEYSSLAVSRRGSPASKARKE